MIHDFGQRSHIISTKEEVIKDLDALAALTRYVNYCRINKVSIADTGMTIDNFCQLAANFIRMTARYANRVDPVHLQVRALAVEMRVVLKALDRSEAKSPKIAELFLTILTDRSAVEATIGDMDEIFAERSQRLGHGSARIWYWSEVVKCIWSFTRVLIMRALGIVQLFEAIRTLFHLP